MEQGLLKFISLNPWLFLIAAAIVVYIMKEMREDYKDNQKRKREKLDLFSTSLTSATRSIDHLSFQIISLDKTLIEMKIDVNKNSKDLNAVHSKIRSIESDVKDLKNENE